MLFEKKIFFTLLLFCTVQFSFAQVKKRTYKTFHETSYAKGDVIFVDVLYHDSRLDYTGIDSVKLIGDFLAAHPTYKIEIGVYNDVRGSSAYNKKSSESRAQCVADYLNKNYNIPYDRMKCYGYGEEFPVHTQEQINKETNTDKKNILYAANRKTEIKILSVK